MKLVRTFHPVGHGAFYTERFYQNDPQTETPLFTAVFDCGCYEKGKKGWSKNRFQQRIEHYANNVFIQGETIDALFISHFHTDHINGLDHLIARCNIKKIFIPIMTPEVILEAYLYSFITTGRRSNVVTRTIERFQNDEELKRKIVTINEDIGPEEIEIPINDINNTFSSGGRISCTFPWYYIPFNRKQNKLSQLLQIEPLLRSALTTTGDVDINALTTIVKSKNAAYWKRVYKQIWKSKHNAYSMTVYSTNLQSILGQCEWNGTMFVNRYDLQNCLYLGDYEAKGIASFKALKHCYNSYWNNISLLQVPHHGSKDNYNAGLYNKPRACIISAGATDVYGHPHNSTITGIQACHCLPILVTEQTYTKQVIQYDI